MSLLKIGAVQVGQSASASNNFHWRNLLDGLLRLSRGNAGAPITDVMRVKADNSVEFPSGVSDPRTLQDVTASRSLGTVFTNTDPYSRIISIWTNASTTLNSYLQATVAGNQAYTSNQAHVAGALCILVFEVKPGESYSVTPVGTAPISKWWERKA